MKKFRKYAFPDGVWEQVKPLIYNEEQYIDCAVVELSNVCITKDDEGNCTEYDPKKAVDILWFADVPSEFDQYEVTPIGVGVHTFAGCEHLYMQRFCELNPDSPYCIKPDNPTE